MATLRTVKTEARYQEFLKQKRDAGCYLCSAPPVCTFKYWKIVRNEYPYDKIASVSHIATLKRHESEEALTKQEKEEWKKLKNSAINECYDAIIESTTKKKSIPAHHHVHLVEFTQDESQMPQEWASIKELENARAL